MRPEQMPNLPSTEMCGRVFDLVAELNGAPAHAYRRDFIIYFSSPSSHQYEWRVSGALGFGGKVRYDRNSIRWSADAYPEDMNDVRRALLAQINDKLDGLSGEMKAERARAASES